MRERLSSGLTLSGVQVDLERRLVIREQGQTELSAREVDLLVWFLAHPIKPVDRATLLREVWGYRGGVPTRVVDMTVRRLREKIESDPSSPIHLLTVRGLGYRFEPPAAQVASERALIGRSKEIEEVLRGLQRERSVVVVWGLPGVGKSALLAAVGARVAEARLVVCDAIRDGAELEALLSASDGPSRTLLVDGVDHLFDALIPLLGGLASRGVVIASRTPLGLPGEVAIPLGPLGAAEAVELFLRGVGEAEDARRHAEEICERLGGIPLAIVLAAAQRSLMSADALLSCVLHAPLSIEADLRALPERHRHLGNALSVALSGLAPWERVALAQLDVFQGDFDVEAAEAVIDVSADEGAPPPWATLRRLIRRGLVEVRRGSAVQPMQLALSPIVAKLVARDLDSAGRAAAERRHAAHFGARSGEAALASIDDVLVATERALLIGEPEIAAACLRALISAGTPSDARFRARWHTAISRWERVRGRTADATAEVVRGIEASRAISDDSTLARSLHQLALLQNVRGELADSHKSIKEAEQLATRAGLVALRGQIRTLAAVSHMERGEYDLAWTTVHAARADLRAAASPRSEQAELDVVEGLCAMNIGRLQEAKRSILSADRWYEETGNHRRRAWSQNNLGEIARMMGDIDGAERFYLAARELFERSGVDEVVAECNLVLCAMARDRIEDVADLVEQTLVRARSQGRAVRIAMLLLARAAILAPREPSAARVALQESAALLAASGFVHEELALLAEHGASRSDGLASEFLALAAAQRK